MNWFKFIFPRKAIWSIS